MQVQDEQKRSTILAVAAEMFASQPFHKVRLSDVAKKASVGKGTVYTYFENKEDLYLSVFYSGFSQLMDQLENRIKKNQTSPEQNLEEIIAQMIRFGVKNPDLFEVMRHRKTGCRSDDHIRWEEKRHALKTLIESIIQEGILQGVFDDPHPELTAWFIPGIIRSAMIRSTHQVSPEHMTRHILRFVLKALSPDKDIPGKF